MALELKNCPHCDGKANLQMTETHSYYIECENCGARTTHAHGNFADRMIAERWNKRVDHVPTAR
jgi:Zn ribbon nucleic-acid-binding protein